MKIWKDKTAAIIPEGEYEVTATRKLQRGQMVVLKNGQVRVAASGETGLILGVCMEQHTGEASAIDARANGTRVRVADGPHTIFACDVPVMTASGGSESEATFSGMAAFANEALTGGRLQLRAVGEGSKNANPIGTIFDIAEHDGAAKTLYLDQFSDGDISAGDSFAVYPPIGKAVGALDSTATQLVLTAATTGFSVKVVGHDYENGKIYLMAKRHVYACDAE